MERHDDSQRSGPSACHRSVTRRVTLRVVDHVAALARDCTVRRVPSECTDEAQMTTSSRCRIPVRCAVTVQVILGSPGRVPGLTRCFEAIAIHR